jgi:predicted TIM-barrel fold metal-dependent hydrolase
MTANLTRRDFLAAAAAAFVPAQRAPEPILDIHQHVLYNGRTKEQLLAHQLEHQITTTVLLPGEGWMLPILGGNRECAAFQAEHPDRFVRFACSDPAESRTPDVLRGNIRRGAIGIGEMKFHVAVDSPEMRQIYKLAEGLGVPVLIHFEYETYDTGLERFQAILKAYPKVNFIGHAQTWWGNVSAELDPLDLYPKGPVKPGGLTDRLLSDYPNIYGDLSAGSGLNALTRDPDFARDFVRRHTRKLVWGSDCDCRDGKGGGIKSGQCLAAQSLPLLRKLAPDLAAFRRIVYENASGLLRLKKP